MADNFTHGDLAEQWAFSALWKAALFTRKQSAITTRSCDGEIAGHLWLQPDEVCLEFSGSTGVAATKGSRQLAGACRYHAGGRKRSSVLNIGDLQILRLRYLGLGVGLPLSFLLRIWHCPDEESGLCICSVAQARRPNRPPSRSGYWR